MALLRFHLHENGVQNVLGQTALREQARELEQWAIHSLNMAPEQQDAYHILNVITKQSNFSLMDLAVETRMKALAEPPLRVPDEPLWRGGFARSTLPPLFCGASSSSR